MFDRWTVKLVRPPLQRGAEILARRNLKPDQVTVAGFCVGLGAPLALAFQLYWLALLCIICNRIMDGLDGALARLTQTSDAGAYLDIVLDFIFYALVVVGFAMADPSRNALAAAVLLTTFIGTGSSFLAFAIMAERRGISNIDYPSKGFYFLGGLAEGTETIAAFVLFCIFPIYFSSLAYVFAALCILTLMSRLMNGYRTLR